VIFFHSLATIFAASIILLSGVIFHACFSSNHDLANFKFHLLNASLRFFDVSQGVNASATIFLLHAAFFAITPQAIHINHHTASSTSNVVSVLLASLLSGSHQTCGHAIASDNFLSHCCCSNCLTAASQNNFSHHLFIAFHTLLSASLSAGLSSIPVSHITLGNHHANHTTHSQKSLTLLDVLFAISGDISHHDTLEANLNNFSHAHNHLCCSACCCLSCCICKVL
jgi:hypothetical protein